MQSDFDQFMRGLRADPRLGRYVPAVPNATPETTILNLAILLANAAEGRQPHPAHVLLERMEDNRG